MTWHLPAEGRDCSDVEATLRSLANDARNIHGMSGGSITIAQRVHTYLRWAEGAERQLASLMDDSAAWRDLHTDQYWAIRELTETSTRPHPLIDDEADRQALRLERIADRMREYRDAFAVREGEIVVVCDTNVHLYFPQFTQIKWCELLNAPRVLYVVPMVVMDELDDQKNKGGTLGGRAGGVIRVLRDLSANFDSSRRVPVKGRRNVELQFLIEPRDHVRRMNHDDETVLQASYLDRLTAGEVAIVTGDGGMQLRANALGLRNQAMPEELRLPDTRKQ